MRVLIIPDIHLPFQHQQSWEALSKYAKTQKFDQVVFLGDVYDFRSINHHRMHLRLEREGERFKTELAAAQKTFDRFVQNLVGRPNVVVCAGNHERFIQKYLSNLPELEHMLPSVTSLFRGCRVFPYQVHKLAYRVGKLHFLHGYGGGGKNTVRKFLDEFNVNLVCGHLHRLEQTSKPSAHGTVSAWCLGYLGDPSIGYEYIQGPTAWQHAFGEAYVRRDGTFNLYSVPIVKGRFTAPSGREVYV